MGYGTRALDALMDDNRFEVKYFLTPRSKLCEDVYEAEKKYKDKLKLEIISTKQELLERICIIKDVQCFLMNACPFILTKEILDNMDFYNIHPGCLSTNRGHQPHLWSVLLNEKETKICLHKVTPKIDLGYVIADSTIKLCGVENSLEILNKAEDEIPVLLEGLYNYLIGKGKIKYLVKDGIYRPIMSYSDYEIKPEDMPEDIDRKIRARFMNNGAFFERAGKRIYVDKIYLVEKSNANSLEQRKNSVVYAANGFKMEYEIKKITDLEGNILYSR